MKQQLTLTIAIPAYNEEANILHILKDIKKQNQSNFTLTKIIVYSDGSTDNTASLIRKKIDSRVVVIEAKKRKGIAKGLNTIIRNTQTDLLVVVNADVVINDPFFLTKLLSPIIHNNADLTSSEIEEVGPKNFFEKVIQVSMLFKKIVFLKYKKGNNLYTCHGLARGFSKKLYKEIYFPRSIGEDAFSYLFTVYHHFTYAFVPDAVAYYRVPDNFADHEKQSIRFLQSKNIFIKTFGKEFVMHEYHLPFYICAFSLLSTLKRFPLHTTLYILVFLGVKIESLFEKQLQETWDISKSSKLLYLART